MKTTNPEVAFNLVESIRLQRTRERLRQRKGEQTVNKKSVSIY
jgi:hypothetical protein